MFRNFKLLLAAVCIFVSSVAVPAAAADISVGLGGAWQSSPYKGHDGMVVPVPFIHVEGERFYIRGLDAGMHIWKDEHHTFSLGASYFGLAFDSDKTDDFSLKRLENRHSTVNVYLQYSLQTTYGQAGVRVLRDVLGKSDAFSAEAFYKYPFMLGPVYVSPGVGVRWDSKEQMDYYFGISSREARKSGLERYRPDGGVSPFLSLEAAWSFTDNWSVMAAGNVLFLSKEAKDSPMVDDSRIVNVTVGIQYTF